MLRRAENFQASVTIVSKHGGNEHFAQPITKWQNHNEHVISED